MSKKSDYARISITLPHEVLAAADRIAASSNRSRSWVIAEAVRMMGDHDSCQPPLPRTQGVREVLALQHEKAKSPLGEQRFIQLQADLELSPEGRVQASEEVARLDTMLRPGHADQLLSFARYEDYLAWDRRSRIRP